MRDLDGAQWRKSTRSGQSGNCVEVSTNLPNIGMRDTKDRNGGTLIFTPDEWLAFMGGVKSGDFDR